MNKMENMQLYELFRRQGYLPMFGNKLIPYQKTYLPLRTTSKSKQVTPTFIGDYRVKF